MHDTDLEENLQALVDSRTRSVSQPTLRRFNLETDSRAFESPREDTSTMEEQSPATSDLIAEREVTHGSFDENARVWQSLCTEANRTAFINDRQRLAFNMIALKLARLIQNPNVRDHWDDIAGYARLGSDGC